jgi:hypothetical protein
MIPVIAGAVAGVAAAGVWAVRRYKTWRLKKINPSPLAASNLSAATANPASVTLSTVHGDPTTVDVRPDAPVLISNTAAGHPVVAIVPNVPGTKELSAPLNAATSSAMQSAHHLYDSLMVRSPDPGLVATFQLACNAEPACMAILDHPLRTDGGFDAATAAMLTVMTGCSFIPAAPMTVNDRINSAGPAAFSATGLYAYLRKFGNVNYYGQAFKENDTTLSRLVKQFQHDVNTDPKYPGPSTADGKAMTNPLPVTGQYDPDTAAALSHVTMDHINA